MEQPVSPEEAVFRAHLAGGRYLSSAAAGRWRFHLRVLAPRRLCGASC